jgi:hypothetical protein
METVIQRQPTLARMDIHVMEISVNLQESGLMDNDARMLEFVVMVLAAMVFAIPREQFLVNQTHNVLDLVNLVTNNLDHIVDFAQLDLIQLQSNLQNAKEIPFKHSLQPNQPMLDVIKQSLNSSVQMLARNALTKESQLLIWHGHTIAKL